MRCGAGRKREKEDRGVFTDAKLVSVLSADMNMRTDKLVKNT